LPHAFLKALLPDMHVAAIDIGTNTALLLICTIDKTGTITPVRHEQRVPRLGKGVDASGLLLEESMDRVARVCEEYGEIMREYPLRHIVVAGTSAVRQATNRDVLIEKIRHSVGFDVEVLSGEDEALWTYRGAISGFGDSKDAVVIDIGGGSTEITFGNGKDVSQKYSLDLGSVRITERFLRNDPPSKSEIDSASDFIKKALGTASIPSADNSLCTGVAGTPTSLAVLDQNLPDFNLKAIAGYKLTRNRITSLFERLRNIPTNEIRKLSIIMEGREDIMVAGTLILHTVMEVLSIDSLTVSERGIRYGLALREWEGQRTTRKD